MQDTTQHADRQRSAGLIVLFNLLPLAFVFYKMWTPFDVVAFYWMEVVAAGGFALLRALGLGLRALGQKNAREFFRHLATAMFMPLHFGFFIVMTCFLVGSFLPEDTEKVPLTSPLVPLEVVMTHVKFWQVFPIVVAWEVVLLALRQMRMAHNGNFRPRSAVTEAYMRLAILFISAFLGLGMTMLMDDRIWGALSLVFFKTFFALCALYGYGEEQKTSVRD